MERHSSPDPWFRLLCALPWLALECGYLEALLAALTLGYWPIPSLNDPKDLQTAPVHALSTLFVLSIHPGALALGMIMIRAWSTVRQSSRYWFWLGFFLLGQHQVPARLEVALWRWASRLYLQGPLQYAHGTCWSLDA